MTEATHPQYPDQPDNFNRRGYTDMALKIYGGYAPAKLDIKKDSREISYQISIEDQIKAAKTLAECLDLEEKDLIINDHAEDALLKPEAEESE